MGKNYQVVSRDDRRTLARWLTKHGQGLLPLVELIESTELAESVGISRSAVSREFVAASEAQLKGLCERRLDELEILIVYIDGIQFAEHT